MTNAGQTLPRFRSILVAAVVLGACAGSPDGVEDRDAPSTSGEVTATASSEPPASGPTTESSRDDDSTDTAGSSASTTTLEAGAEDGSVFGPRAGSPPPGIDPALDALWVACDEGADGGACDNLYLEAPTGAEHRAYLLFGDTCGGRTEQSPCTDLLGGTSDRVAFPSEYTNKLGHWDLSRIPPTGSAPPGEVPALDEQWVGCSGGDPAACLSLNSDGAIGSVYEAFGASCGGRKAIPSTSCRVALMDPADFVPPGSPPPGDDPALDALWIACADGNGSACFDLVLDADSGTAYDFWGATCGGFPNTEIVLPDCVDYAGER